MSECLNSWAGVRVLPASHEGSCRSRVGPFGFTGALLGVMGAPVGVTSRELLIRVPSCTCWSAVCHVGQDSDAGALHAGGLVANSRRCVLFTCLVILEWWTARSSQDSGSNVWLVWGSVRHTMKAPGSQAAASGHSHMHTVANDRQSGTATVAACRCLPSLTALPRAGTRSCQMVTLWWPVFLLGF